jgi:hypothetical protein
VSITDSFGRPIRDLRISVTDRCNFRCVYCMPKEVFGPGYQFLKLANLLSYEEIARRGDLRRPRGAQDPPHRGRALGAPKCRGADRDADRYPEP